MRLIDIMIGILAKDDGFDIGEGRVAGPAVDVFAWGEDFFAGECFVAQEAFEVEERGGGEVVFEGCEPGGVQGVDFEFEELFLLVGEFGEPGFFVEGGGLGWGCCCWGGGWLGGVEGAAGGGLWLAELPIGIVLVCPSHLYGDI